MNTDALAYALDLIAMYESAKKNPAISDSAFNTLPEPEIDAMLRGEKGTTRWEKFASFCEKRGMSTARRTA